MLFRTCRSLLQTASTVNRSPVLTQCQRRATQSFVSQRRAASTHFELNTGAKIPALGIGTWQDADHQEKAVHTALKAGYRHIDGARVYGTEAAVGRAMKSSGVPRGDIFLTTKLWNNSHHPEDVEKACDASLKDLGTDYLDLYLMHWPSPFKRGDELRPKDGSGRTIPGNTDFVDTWKAMEDLVAKEKVRAIGISNFSKSEIERLMEHTVTIPAVHQIELHPWLQQKTFTNFHKVEGIHVSAYSPLGNANSIYSKGQQYPQLMADETLTAIGKKHGKTGAQTALAWGINMGFSVLPKSKTPERIIENLGADFELPQEDMDKIAGLDKKLRLNDPSAGFRWNFYEGLDGKEAY